MEKRLQKIIDAEKITPARFAELLGVQRSAISHILSGRNKPSFDLIHKIITKFPRINADWLITGNGEMYRTFVQRTLFDDIGTNQTANKDTPVVKSNEQSSPKSGEQPVFTDVKNKGASVLSSKNVQIEVMAQAAIKKIVIFYSDSSFEEYNPK